MTPVEEKKKVQLVKTEIPSWDEKTYSPITIYWICLNGVNIQLTSDEYNLLWGLPDDKLRVYFCSKIARMMKEIDIL